MKVKVGVSARHVHLKEQTYNKLFDEPLEKLKDLDQPTQFSAKQTVTIKNENHQIDNVRIVGPLRDYDQVEISKTDAYKFKVDPPIRTSSDISGSLPIDIIGPKGTVHLEEGLIIANRHIHITKEDAKKYSLENIEKLAVKINGEKPGIIENVYLKIKDESSLRLHLDTDDANAFCLKDNDEVEVLKIKE